VNVKNDSMNLMGADNIVNEGQFYFKSWPNPQERQEEGRLYN